ncbi:hypothetical protein, partial [Actinophytocola sp.]|uniref:hypothetical protein n=1 Tax=Actinophytocola sp. TaxID=1872138 RepID=UPI002EDB413C
MDGELELRGHGWIVDRLDTVRSGAGEVLLVSQDTNRSVRVWDPATGAPVAGPVPAERIAEDLAGLRLGAADLAVLAGATLVPAAERSPARLVRVSQKQVRVTDLTTGRVESVLAQPPDPPGHIGDQIHATVGVRLGDGTAGFAAVRWGSDVEVWSPGRRKWRKRALTSRAGGPLAAMDGTHVAVVVPRKVEVYDAATGELVAGVRLDGRVNALAAVPLARRTLLAVAFDGPPDAVVQLLDPYAGRRQREPLTRHGPAFGGTSPGLATVLAVTSVPGPGGTVRIASGGNDGMVRLSAPLGTARPPPR